MKVGISFVSVANAQANLAAEQPASTSPRVRADRRRRLEHRPQPGPGHRRQRPPTCRSSTPRCTTCCRTRTSPATSTASTAASTTPSTPPSHPVYQNYSGWDIYRSWAALIALIAPDEASDIVKSMVLDGQQGGLLPKWSHQTNEDFVMTGDPGPIIVASAVRVRRARLRHRRRAGADEEELQRRHHPGQRRSAAGRAATSPAHYIDERPVRLPGVLGVATSRSPSSPRRSATPRPTTRYMTRAQWWRNVFNTESGYVHHAQRATARWPWPLNPASRVGYTEGNAVPVHLDGHLQLRRR